MRFSQVHPSGQTTNLSQGKFTGRRGLRQAFVARMGWQPALKENDARTLPRPSSVSKRPDRTAPGYPDFDPLWLVVVRLAQKSRSVTVRDGSSGYNSESYRSHTYLPV